MSILDSVDDGIDPFEEFNRSAGMGLVDNPYPLFAMVRPDNPMKREELDAAVLVPDEVGTDVDFMPLNRDIGVYTAYGYDAVQQVLKDGDAFSSKGYAEVM